LHQALLLRGRSRAILSADQINVTPMVFELRNDQRSESGSWEITTFHSSREISLLVASMLLFALSIDSYLYGIPEHPARIGAVVIFGVASTFLLFGGLTSEINFRRDIRCMEVKWKLFGRDLCSHSHPYSAVRITKHFYQVQSTRWTTGRSSRWEILADVGLLRYTLNYPGAAPTDIEMRKFKKELGFPDGAESQNDSPSDVAEIA
jgi:hypothetical protein